MSEMQNGVPKPVQGVEYLNRFLDEIHEWSLTGTEPALASRELRYVLDCQEKRLHGFGLEMEQRIDHTEGEITGSLAQMGAEIEARTLYREAVRYLFVRREGKVIFREKEPVTVYATKLDKPGYKDATCTCPNCGHEALASSMREGCPYCGTVFEMEDAWPVFSSYYRVPGIVERSTLMPRLKRTLLTVFIVAAVVMALLFWLTGTDYDPVPRVLVSLFGGAMMGAMTTFVAYLIFGFALMGKVFKEAGKSLPLLKGLRTGTKLEAAMRPFEPDFSYAYFEGRLISLLRAIAFTDDRRRLSIYEGNQDLSFLNSLVDMQYRGALELRDFRVEDGAFKVQLRAFMDDLRYEGRVRRRTESFLVTVEKDIAAGGDPGFSLHKVHCRGCGASFDALHRKDCPYCGNPYRLLHDDWMITSIEQA